MDNAEPPRSGEPVTTIAWRLAHETEVLSPPRARRFEGAFHRPSFEYASSAQDALRQLADGYEAWMADVQRLGASGLAPPAGVPVTRSLAISRWHDWSCTSMLRSFLTVPRFACWVTSTRGGRTARLIERVTVKSPRSFPGCGVAASSQTIQVSGSSLPGQVVGLASPSPQPGPPRPSLPSQPGGPPPSSTQLTPAWSSKCDLTVAQSSGERDPDPHDLRG